MPSIQSNTDGELRHGRRGDKWEAAITGQNCNLLNFRGHALRLSAGFETILEAARHGLQIAATPSPSGLPSAGLVGAPNLVPAHGGNAVGLFCDVSNACDRGQQHVGDSRGIPHACRRVAAGDTTLVLNMERALPAPPADGVRLVQPLTLRGCALRHFPVGLMHVVLTAAAINICGYRILLESME